LPFTPKGLSILKDSQTRLLLCTSLINQEWEGYVDLDERDELDKMKAVVTPVLEERKVRNCSQ